MGALAGNLELYARILESVLDDLARLLSTQPFTQDKIYIRSRLANEGLAFLTVTLPKLGKCVDEWMRDESKELFFGQFFRPSFLRGLRTIVSARGETPDRIVALRGLRQIGFLFYKLELPYTDRQLSSTINEFREVEHELAVQQIPYYSEEFVEARRLVDRLLCRERFEELTKSLHPRHGPGAVATGEKGAQKWSMKRLFPLFGEICDFREMYHLPPYSSICSDEANHMLRSLIIDPHPTSLLVAVPKDSRGPRLICEEPLEMQYLQQWAFQILDQIIEESPWVVELSMRDQSRNQVLAAEGSITSEWATLDLKEASDRVSLALVLNLFPKWFEPWLRALRSVRIKLPTGKIIPTLKFAPMGSAICFPIETIVFWSLSRAVCALHGRSNRLPRSTASVFGDDIIVPNEMYGPVCEMLESCGLVVNRVKSYHTGRFRESCGYDAYDGYDVSPVRIKHAFPSSWKQVDGLANFVAVSNGFEERCYHLTATLISEELYKVAPLLTGNNTGEFSLLNGRKPFKKRWNRFLHREEVFTYKVGTARVPFAEGYERLRRSVISPVHYGDPSTLIPPRSARVEKGWTRTP